MSRRRWLAPPVLNEKTRFFTPFILSDTMRFFTSFRMTGEDLTMTVGDVRHPRTAAGHADTV
jgi:hypothetical protein